MRNRVTTNEIMEFLRDNMVTREEFQGLEENVRSMTAEIATKKELRVMQHRILDKMQDMADDLRGDLILLVRKADNKLLTLVDILLKKEVIGDEEAKYLLSLQPFPKNS